MYMYICAYSMARDQLCGSMCSKSRAAVLLASLFCATPKFLVVLRVPVRMLGNDLFPNGFEGFPYALCGPQTANEPTGMYSEKWLILVHAFRVREMSLQPMVFHDFPITIRFPGWHPGCL